MQWKITDEKAWTVILEADLIAYVFVEVSISDKKNHGRRIFYARWFSKVCGSQFNGISALFNTPKKHVLTHFVPVLLVDYMHLIITGSACYVFDLLIVSRSSALSTHLHVYIIVISHVFALFRSDHKW